jgi:hypothetical protein
MIGLEEPESVLEVITELRDVLELTNEYKAHTLYLSDADRCYTNKLSDKLEERS